MLCALHLIYLYWLKYPPGEVNLFLFLSPEVTIPDRAKNVLRKALLHYQNRGATPTFTGRLLIVGIIHWQIYFDVVQQSVQHCGVPLG
jgi:hypothetical protein